MENSLVSKLFRNIISLMKELSGKKVIIIYKYLYIFKHVNYEETTKFKKYIIIEINCAIIIMSHYNGAENIQSHFLIL